MPSERKSTRGKTRSKARALRRIRARLLSCEAARSANNPVAIGSHPGSSIPGREAVMAATPQPRWRASLNGLRAETRYSLVKMWAHKRFVLLFLTIFLLVLLCYYLNTGPSIPPTKVLPQSKKEAKIGQRHSCIPKENQVVKACNELQDYNMSECLDYKCCYSPFRTSNLSCFAPLKDMELSDNSVMQFEGRKAPDRYAGYLWKAQGTVARVHIGQVIMSISTKLQNKEHVIKALCGTKFKFPGHQKIHTSRKWGFTKFNVDEFEDTVAEK
ncbi:hypothetical protein PANDA_007293 [Ailuropoda melanoleuca]|uniref:Ribosomal protein L10e/L16 domain-containing protein n=1 Tax=Ailuropoda melanoleuca TaxID=9646 RepID=D2HA79_AILME|nr:hypothetical protein PANDA_007293 [Ailuropoda melanoleuca]